MKLIVGLLALAVLAGCASAPMTLPDYYAAIIEVNGVILGVIELDGRLFFIGTVPEPGWTPPVVETTQS